MKNSHNRWLKFVFLILFMPLLGCEKDEYTLPVDFRMKFAINNAPVMNGSVIIDYIGISLSSLDISGIREEGGDVFLTRTFGGGKLFSIYPSNNTGYEKLNIPHGLYNPITFTFNFQPDEDESDLLDEILSWIEEYNNQGDLLELQESLGDIIEDYLEFVDPCIIVTGKYIDRSVTKNIIILINDPIVFNTKGKSATGLNEVFLNRKTINTGILQFNPAYWFSVITPAIMNTAFTGLIETEEYIFLSKHINHQIYFTLFNRIEESTTLHINE